MPIHQEHKERKGPDPAEPADYPYVTSVGGTELSTYGPSGNWASETVWGNQEAEGIGTGGGISPVWPIPSWQTDVSMSANNGSTTMRNFPDVAIVADQIWVLYGNGSSNAYYGTSLASPLWAGFAALANQQAAANGYPPVGFLNPALYAVGTGRNYSLCFQDITTGNNEWPGSPSEFVAVAGYDLCTGWGTPIGTNLINEIIRDSAGPLGSGHFPSSSSFTFCFDYGAANATAASSVYDAGSLPVSCNPSPWTNLGSFNSSATNGLVPFTNDTVSGVTQRFYMIKYLGQIYGVTAFAKVSVPALSLALLANQLYAPINTLNGLFSPMPDGTYLPTGTQIYKQNTNGSWTFDTYTWTTSGTSGYWTNSYANTNVGALVKLAPGQGFWLSNPSSEPITVSFAGLVPQGNHTTSIPTNEWIYSSILPQAGGLTTNLKYYPNAGDTVYIWNPAAASYNSYTYFAGAWGPSEPSLQVGQSFVLSPGAATNWTQSFSTCGP